MTSSTSEKSAKKVIVIGGGLVGSLDALYFAQNGYSVDLFESRPDPRKETIVAGRSINLALSVRGRSALAHVGVEEEVVKNGIPMHARMIHDHDGTCTPLPYGKKGQYILSVDRRKLNEHLLSATETRSNAKMHFAHKAISVNLEEGSAVFERPDGTKQTFQGDLIVGCDGAFSSVRKAMLRKTRMDYNQMYIPHGYKEISLPPSNGDFAMPVGYLHIWPRNTFMMIALPNQDKSFTCTLFMPFDYYDRYKTNDEVIGLFQEHFPDFLKLIGETQLLSDFAKNPVGDAISIKCSPYHYKDRCVIKGDAAHAMVPFYGQGMNCGFEDCLVFDEILNANNMDLEKTLTEYSAHRSVDAHAMCDLALYNYVEMRSHVNSRLFLLKRSVERLLHWLLPSVWVPLYTMVTFSRRRYHAVIRKTEQQDKVLSCAFVVSALGIAYIGYRAAARLPTQSSAPAWPTIAAFSEQAEHWFNTITGTLSRSS